MGKIHVLDSEISNKIAAGEVVERPASVIKELVENSIDASSTVITVEIKSGGAAYMRVTDNGYGMSEEDAAICFLRHATSKIQKSEDLNAIYTLGFRGEALSSIGAVAKVLLYTKRKEDTCGFCVSCEGGDIVSSEDAGVPDGTTIIVESLFYNTPARLKFLKKDNAEAAYITDIMTRFIFAHPEISFKLIVNGKEKLFSPGDSNINNAVYTIYGKDYAKGMLTVDYEQDGIRVSGVIGKGNISRPKRNYQSFFVNGRYIRSPLMTRALEDAYKNQIMIGKFPVCVLNLEINPEAIDINVHPTKLEVKFSDEREIYNVIYYAAKNALYELPAVPKIERTDKSEKSSPKKAEQLDISQIWGAQSTYKKNDSFSIESASRLRDKYKREAGIQSAPSHTPTPSGIIKLRDSAKEIAYTGEPLNNLPPLSMTEHTSKAYGGADGNNAFNQATKDSLPEEKNEKSVITDEISLEKAAVNESAAEDDGNVFIDEYFEIVGQIFDSYIIAQKGNEMLIIDQHAAHERLKYEELKKDMEAHKAMSQMILEPVIINVTGDEINAFRENAKTFSDMGFECEEFGEDALIIRGVPGEVSPEDAGELMLELIAAAQNYKNELMTPIYERLTYTIACKAAVKANTRLSVIETETLVRDVLRLKNINTCPHGRPIIVTMSKKEIEKEFKRIV